MEINLSSPEFIQKLKERDSESIELLIISYHDALFSAALKQGLAIDQAQEVVQDTWASFFEQVERFEGRSHIRTYLFGIMYNKTKELWRSNKKYTHDFDDQAIEQLFHEDGHYQTPPLDPADWIQNTQVSEIISKALLQLPENQRMAFHLKVIQGEDTGEICNIMAISSTNLGVLLYRAKHALRLILEQKLTKEDQE